MCIFHEGIYFIFFNEIDLKNEMFLAIREEHLHLWHLLYFINSNNNTSSLLNY